MKSSKAAIHSRSHKIPDISFDDNENQSLTSFAGLVTYQHLFQRLRLKERLKHCFASRASKSEITNKGPIAIGIIFTCKCRICM